MLFVAVIVIIAAGIIALLKGVRGRWDQNVKPEEMLGPGNHNNDDDSEDKS